MRRLAIFLYFLFLTTLSLRVGDLYAMFVTVTTFVVFYFWAELLDKEDDNDLVDRNNQRKEECI
jgi:uncharacterized membrane protein